MSDAAVRRSFRKALEAMLPQNDLRCLRAWRLVSSGNVHLQAPLREDRCVAEVDSQSEPGLRYTVQYDPRRGWACDCTDFQVRGGRRDHQCKHIRAVSWVWGSIREAV